MKKYACTASNARGTEWKGVVEGKDLGCVSSKLMADGLFPVEIRELVGETYPAPEGGKAKDPAMTMSCGIETLAAYCGSLMKALVKNDLNRAEALEVLKIIVSNDVRPSPDEGILTSSWEYLV